MYKKYYFMIYKYEMTENISSWIKYRLLLDDYLFINVGETFIMKITSNSYLNVNKEVD